MAKGIISKFPVTEPAKGYVICYVTKEFYLLTHEQKQKTMSEILAYFHDGASAYSQLRLIDNRSENHVGDLTEETGLVQNYRLKEN